MTVPQDLKDKIASYANILNVPDMLIPEYDGYSYEGMSYIEYKDGLYHLAASERGEDITRVSTPDMHEFLFIVFVEITRSLSRNYEEDTNPIGIDPRRLQYEKQSGMMMALDEQWGLKLKIIQEAEVENYPFDDFTVDRTHYQNEVLANGEAEKTARQMRLTKTDEPPSETQIYRQASSLAETKYPYPKRENS